MLVRQAIAEFLCSSSGSVSFSREFQHPLWRVDEIGSLRDSDESLTTELVITAPR